MNNHLVIIRHFLAEATTRDGQADRDINIAPHDEVGELLTIEDYDLDAVEEMMRVKAEQTGGGVRVIFFYARVGLCRLEMP